MIFFIFFFIVLINCSFPERTLEKMHPSDFAGIIILYEKSPLINIKKDLPYKEIMHENEKKYIFESFDLSDIKDKEESQTLVLKYKIEIQILNDKHKLYKTITDSDYNLYFQNLCLCNFSRKGWTLLDNENVREYHYFKNNEYVISRHLNWKGFLIRIDIFSSNSDILYAENNIIKNQIQLIK